MIELVILDCDGVLFDSWKANIAYYNEVLRRLGLAALNEAWQRKVHFLASSQVWDVMFGEGSDLARAARGCARSVDYGPFFEFMEPVPELHETLATLRRSYHLAMATNRGTTIPEIIERFELAQYLELAVGVNDVARPKPHPDMIEACCGHFDVAPARAVFVGDAATDLAAARAAGTHFVAVGNIAGADRQIASFSELSSVLAMFDTQSPAIDLGRSPFIGNS